MKRKAKCSQHSKSKRKAKEFHLGLIKFEKLKKQKKQLCDGGVITSWPLCLKLPAFNNPPSLSWLIFLNLLSKKQEISFYLPALIGLPLWLS